MKEFERSARADASSGRRMVYAGAQIQIAVKSDTRELKMKEKIDFGVLKEEI